MSFHQPFWILGFFILVHRGCSLAPTLDLQVYDPNDAIRPSGSSGGGLVKGVDTYIFHATVTRDAADPDSTKFLDTDIRVDVGTDVATSSVDFERCHTLAECPPADQTGCYCKSQTGNNYNLVFKRVADDQHLGEEIRLRWLGGNTPLNPATHPTSSSQKLPPISPAVLCDPKTVTSESEGKAIQLSESGNNTLQKTKDSSELTFRVSGLFGTYEVKIELDGITLASTTNNATISTTVPDTNVGKEYILSFSEPTVNGCGRSGSYSVFYAEATSGGGDDCDTVCIVLIVIAGVLVIGIIVGITCQCILGQVVITWIKTYIVLIVILCVVVFGIGFLCGVFLIYCCCQKEEKKKPGKDQPPSTNGAGGDVEAKSGGPTGNGKAAGDGKESVPLDTAQGDGSSKPHLPPITVSTKEGNQRNGRRTTTTDDAIQGDAQGDVTDGLHQTSGGPNQQQGKKKKRKPKDSPTKEESENSTADTDKPPRALPTPRNKGDGSGSSPRPLPALRNAPRQVGDPSTGVNTSVSNPNGLETQFVTHSQSPIGRNRPVSIETTNHGGRR